MRKLVSHNLLILVIYYVFNLKHPDFFLYSSSDILITFSLKICPGKFDVKFFRRPNKCSNFRFNLVTKK